MEKVGLWLERNPLALKAIPALSFLLFLLACVTPAIYVVDTSGWESSWAGWQLLLIGWIAPLLAPPVIGWYANPILWAAWVLLLWSKWKGSFALGLLALALGLTSFLLRSFPAGFDSPTFYSVTGFGIGAYWWFASMVVVVLGAALSDGLELVSNTEENDGAEGRGNHATVG